MTKNIIHLDEALSQKAYNICSDNEIYNFQELKEYYLNNNSFKYFRNSDEKTNNELIELCLKNSDGSSENKIINQNQIEGLKSESVSSNIIHLDEVLSTKAYNICSDNEIYNFNELKNCLLSCGSFKHFRKCGIKTNNELIELCLRNSNGSFEKKIIKLKQKKIEGLKSKRKGSNLVFIDENLSQGAYNTCSDNEVYNFLELKQQYLFYGSFRHFRNSCDKTNNELINLCTKHNIYKTQYDYKIIKINQILIQDKIDNLNSAQVHQINNYIIEKTISLSTNSQKVLKRYLKNELDLIAFTKHIFSFEVIELSNIKSIAKKSIPELGFYLKHLIEFILNVYNIEEEEELIKTNYCQLIEL